MSSLKSYKLTTQANTNQQKHTGCKRQLRKEIQRPINMNTSAFVMMKRKHVQQQGLLYFPNTYGTERGCTSEKVGVRWP